MCHLHSTVAVYDSRNSIVDFNSIVEEQYSIGKRHLVLSQDSTDRYQSLLDLRLSATPHYALTWAGVTSCKVAQTKQISQDSHDWSKSNDRFSYFAILVQNKNEIISN